MTRSVAVAWTVLVLAGLGAGPELSAGQAASQAELRKPFVGTWRLVEIQGGRSPAARGARPSGVIFYDAHGNMAAQIMPDRARPKWTGTPTPEQALEAFRGYTAYFGTYTIDDQAKTVTHHRQGMLDGGAVDFVRRFTFAPGDRITLTPVNSTGPETHLTWEKVK
jgi:hypothetical protein